MPLFEFECETCGERFEVLIARSKAQSGVPCEKCGSPNTKRLLSPFAGHARPDIGQAQAFARQRTGARD